MHGRPSFSAASTARSFAVWRTFALYPSTAERQSSVSTESSAGYCSSRSYGRAATITAPSDFSFGRHSAALHGFSRFEPHICTGSGASSGFGKNARNCPLSVMSSRPTKIFSFVDRWRSNSSSHPSWVFVSVNATPSSPNVAARSRSAFGLSSQPFERWECACRSISMRLP